jgi:hypothetical protein
MRWRDGRDWSTIAAVESARRVPGRLSALSGYELRHLGRHLLESGRHDRLVRLLRLDTGDGRNAWYEAKWAIDDLDGFQGDLRGAWRSAAADVGEQIGHALLAASIGGLARRLPTDLLTAMVEYGVVSPSYAVQSVRQVPGEAERATAVDALASYLPEEHLLQLFDIARGIEAGSMRARAVAAVAPHLPQRLRSSAVAEALDNAALRSPEEWSYDEEKAWQRTAVLGRLAPVIVALDREDPARELTAALLRLARSFGGDGALRAERCAIIMATIIPHLDATRARAATAEALTVAQSIKDIPSMRRRAQAALLPFLPPWHRRRLVYWWRFMTFDDAKDAVELLGLVVTSAPEQDRRDALARLVRRLPRVDFEGHQLEAITVVAPYVRAGSPEATALIGLVQNTADTAYRIEELAAILPFAPEDRRRDWAVEVAEHHEVIRYGRGGAALVRVAPFLPDDVRRRTLERAFTRETRQDDEGLRVRLSAELAVRVDAGRRSRAVVEDFTAAAAITDDDDYAKAVATLAPMLTSDQLAAVLHRAEGIPPDTWLRGQMILSVAAYLPEHLLDRALDILAATTHDLTRQQLAELAHHLSPAQRERALEIAFALDELPIRADAALQLLPQLPADAQTLVLVRLLQLCRGSDDRKRLDVLVALAPQLREDLRAEAVELALQVAEQREYFAGESFVLRPLAELLPEHERGRLLDVVRRNDHPVSRYDSLRALAPVLPASAMQEALDLARERWHRHSGQTLTALLPHVPDALLDQAVDLVTGKLPDSETWPAEMIAALAPRLPQPALQRLFETARGFEEQQRGKALAALFPHLSPEHQTETLTLLDEKIQYGGARDALTLIAPHIPPRLWPRALQVAEQIDQISGRGDVLAAFAPHVPRTLLAALLDCVDRLTWRGKALGDIAAHLPPDLVPRALEIAVHAQTDSDRGTALATLAPHLTGDVLHAAAEAALAISDVGARAEATTSLASRCPDLLTTALLDVSRIVEPRDRLPLLRALAPHVDGAVIPWRQVLENCASRGRPELLEDLWALSPWGDDPALAAAVLNSITQCGTWWP